MIGGILPWNWFSSSLMESSGALVAGGNLIKKVLFPAEILPLVNVFANMVHFFLGGDPICARVAPETEAHPEQILALTADMNNMHLMDADTGRVV